MFNGSFAFISIKFIYLQCNKNYLLRQDSYLGGGSSSLQIDKLFGINSWKYHHFPLGSISGYWSVTSTGYLKKYIFLLL